MMSAGTTAPNPSRVSAPEPSPTIGRASRRIRGFGSSAHGVAIVEFALIVPFLFALYVGTAEFCRAMMNSQALTRLARTVADLAALSTPPSGGVKIAMDQSEVDDIFSASTLVLRPFDASTVKIRLTAIGISMKGTARTVRVCSSAASKNATARSVGAAPADLDIPSSYNVNGQRLVVAEVDMDYKPLMGKAFTSLTHIGANGTYPLKAKFVWPVRGGKVYSGSGPEVVLPNGVQCPATSP